MSDGAGHVEVAWLQSCAVVSLVGAHTAFTAPLLRRRLVDVLMARGAAIVVDTTDVSDIDPATLGVLLGLERGARQLGRAFLLVVDPHPGAVARQTLARTGLDRVLPLATSRAEALERLLVPAPA